MSVCGRTIQARMNLVTPGFCIAHTAKQALSNILHGLQIIYWGPGACLGKSKQHDGKRFGRQVLFLQEWNMPSVLSRTEVDR